jgi:sortase A
VRKRTYEVAAWCACFLCFGALVAVEVQAHSVAVAASHIGTAVANPVARVQPDSSIGDGVMGRLEIHSIGLTVPILEGFDPDTLRKGVGHVQGTAMPGGLGNMALAGHRDTFFRPLRNIRKGMTMSVFTDDGRYDYAVDSTEIVNPEDVRVVSIHSIPEMTLITCYPFDFIGSAPHRFIVTAHLKSIEPTK